MNVRKMRQIGKDILAEPRRFNMTAWFGTVYSKGTASILDHSEKAIPPCGTVCCFAGEWAMRYAKAQFKYDGTYHDYSKDKDEYIENACVNHLDLPNRLLIHQTRWPGRLRTKHKAGTKAYAKHFVNKVLEDYIATNGWQDEW